MYLTPIERSRLLKACRVPPAVPMGDFYPWVLDRVKLNGETAELISTGPPTNEQAIARLICCWDTYVILGRWTEAKMHLPHGDIVMLDHQMELMKHLPILIHGAGRVLVTGLGLGCVVRGLLTRDQVDHIDVIELDRKIVDRIGPEFAGNDRVTLHHADALTFPLNGQRWDFAWHDLWDESRPLAMLHADVMTRFFTKVTRQGAWELPRWVKRRWGRSEWLMNRRIKLP
jgi:hypothetical protein